MQSFQISLLFVAVLSLLYGIGEIISFSRNKFSWLLSAAFFSIFILSFHAYLLFTGILIEFPFLLGWYIPFNFMIGPFFSRYATERLRISSSTKLLPHLIPAIISAFVLIFFHLESSVPIRESILLAMDSPTSSREFPLLGFLNLHFLIYIGNL